MTLQPTLHMLCGKIAAGKSTLSAKLGENERTVVICEDRWAAQLYGPELQTSYARIWVTERIKRRTFRMMRLRFRRGILHLGRPWATDFVLVGAANFSRPP